MSKGLRLLLALIGAVLVVWGLSCNMKSSEQRLQEATQAVLVDDGSLCQDYSRAIEGYPVDILVATLPGDVLANTSVFNDHAVIRVDVSKVMRKRDRLEPVLGHEIYHVVDARFKYGLENFYALVERDKAKDWHYREVEVSAVQQENALRQRLLKSPKYQGMAATRELQNGRH